MTYRSVAEAREAGGLRLVLTAGVPAPWGESAKNILHVKAIPYVAVAQMAGLPNDELVAWTGHANAPVAMYEQEPARAGWAEILFLAERLRPEPRLIPDDARERATMFGLCHEICGENGFGWTRRLMLVDQLLQPGVPEPMRRTGEVLAMRYGHSKEAAAAAPARLVALLDLLAGQLRRQNEAGHEFLVGAALSAADLYWAAFSSLVRPMPPEQCPIPDSLRGWYTNLPPEVEAAMDPALFEHRDRIYGSYLELPMSF